MHVYNPAQTPHTQLCLNFQMHATAGHTHAHTHTIMLPYIHTYIHTYIHLHKYICTHIPTCMKTHTHIHLCVCIYIYIYVHTCPRSYVFLYVCIYMYIYAHICTAGSRLSPDHVELKRQLGLLGERGGEEEAPGPQQRRGGESVKLGFRAFWGFRGLGFRACGKFNERVPGTLGSGAAIRAQQVLKKRRVQGLRGFGV